MASVPDHPDVACGVLAFWLTCLVEVPWWIVGLRGAWSPTDDRRANTLRTGPLPIGLTLVLNLLTHPIVWRLTAGRSMVDWVLAELGALIVEVFVAGGVLKLLRARQPWTTAVLFALGANATSALIGVLFF